MNHAIIQTEGLRFAYAEEGAVNPFVLDGVSLDIEEGSFVAVLGHNGSGKSTLAKHLNAILLPSGGKVYVDGIDTADEDKLLDIRRTVGMVFQNPDNQIDLVKADKSLAIETGYQEGTVFHKLLRLRSARTYPLMLETTFLPQSRFLTLDTEALSCGSLYEFLREQYNFHADRATEKFRPVMPRSEERTLLHISSNVPCTLLERYSYEGNVLIEYTKSIVRGDKYAFRIELANNSVIPLPEQRER